MRAASWLAAAAIALALVESVLGLWGPRSVAGDADWAAAAAHVRAQLQPDDLVVFAPAWIDQVGRKHLGDRMPIEMVARADDDRYARIWELSVRGARAEDTAGLQPVETRAFGRVTVHRYDKPAVKVLHDLTSAFAASRVTTQPLTPLTPPPPTPSPSPSPPSDETPCGGDAKSRGCGPSRVEPRVLEIDYRPRRGILVPAVAGRRITLAWDDVPGGQLVGHVGLHDYYARKNGEGVVTFRVRAEDQAVILPVRVPAKEGDGWQRFELALPPGAHTVRVEIEGEHLAHRLVGFHAEVRAP